MSKTVGPLKSSHSPSSVTYDVDTSKKSDVMDVDMKLQHNTTTIRGPLRRGNIKLSSFVAGILASLLFF